MPLLERGAPAAPFYNNYRWQRQPAESMSFARNFRVGKEGKYNLQVRGEFQNIFNRTFLSAPSLANPLSRSGQPTAGGSHQQFRLRQYCHPQWRWSSAAQRSAHWPVYLLTHVVINTARPGKVAGVFFMAEHCSYSSQVKPLHASAAADCRQISQARRPQAQSHGIESGTCADGRLR